MANITLSIQKDTYEEMKLFPEIRWSEIARKAIVEKIAELKMIEQIANKSKLTQKDVDEFSKKIKSSSTKRFMDEYNNR